MVNLSSKSFFLNTIINGLIIAAVRIQATFLRQCVYTFTSIYLSIIKYANIL